MPNPYEPRLDAGKLAIVRAAFDAGNMKGLAEDELQRTFRSLRWAWHRMRVMNEALNVQLSAHIEAEGGRSGSEQTRRERHRDRKRELLARAEGWEATTPGVDDDEVAY